MSQEALARALGMKGKSYICSIEKGEAKGGKIPVLVALAINREFGASIGPLAGLTTREIELVAQVTKRAA